MKALFAKSILALTLIMSLPISAKGDQLADLVREVKKTEFIKAIKDEVYKIAPECEDFFAKQLDIDADCAYGFAKTQALFNKVFAKLSFDYLEDLKNRLKEAKAPADRIISTKDLQGLYDRDGIKTYQDLEDRRSIILSMAKQQEFSRTRNEQGQLAAQWEEKASSIYALNEEKQKNKAAKANIPPPPSCVCIGTQCAPPGCGKP